MRRPTKHPLPPSPFPTSTDAKRPVAVAITGGIGAGKSAALEAFARHGAATRSSDEIVHGLLRSDPAVLSKIAERFGAEVVGEEGADRAAIARIVFNDPAELEWLEQLLHPKVVREQASWRRHLAESSDPPAVAAVEVPLLYETGGDERFDAVVVITASPGVRSARRPQTDARAKRLIPDEEKVRRADYAYVNDGTLDELDAFVVQVLGELAG
ncbi:MAG: dephospho-CoA kinase [Gaiellaceae bacterium]|nr:dephospho-CoA kinase [Gaiellaceae bacterium]